MSEDNMSFDCLKVERALMGLVALDQLNPKELDIHKNRKVGFEIGRLAHRMAQGYYAHAAALEVARAPSSRDLASTILQSVDGKPVSVSYVARKDGTQHVVDFHHFLAYLNNPEIRDDFDKTWLVGSLLSVGDVLQKHNYLDHAPILELLYHLRNGIAHGNKFNITSKGLERLKKYPAHNKHASVKSTEFEISEALRGKTILFDFLGPADVLDLLFSIEIHLTHVCVR